MFLSELKVHAAVLSDEDPDIQTVVRYANSRIAHVNRVAKQNSLSLTLKHSTLKKSAFHQ